MQQVRVGVIGVGGMGTFHARALAGLAGVELVAVADPFEPNTALLHDEFGCRTHADPMELARATDIDGVVIASPDATHADLTIAALECGTRVLCEKPISTTVEDAIRIAAAEQRIGERRVQLAFMREYDPPHTQLVHALGGLGRIDFLRTVHRNANASPRSVQAIIGQSLVHDIHSVRFITGQEFVSVRSFGSGASNGSFRHVVVVAELASGAHASLEFDDCGFAYEVSVEVLAEHGDVVTSGPTRAVERRDGAVVVDLGTDWFGWFADAYRIQDQAWVDSIRRRVAVGPTTWDGVASQAVVAAALESLRTQTTCRVATFDRPTIYA